MVNHCKEMFLIVYLYFCRQLKQTARIYHIKRKFGFGDYTAGSVGNMTEIIRNYLRIFFSIFGPPG